MCSVLQAEGYRGILGLDALITGRDILFLEINPRFQGSSLDLNRALWERGFPSLQELNEQAFSSDLPSRGRDELEALLVGYSSFSFSGIHRAHLDSIYRHSFEEPRVEDCLGDGFDPMQPSDEEAHQFTLQFRDNIASARDGNLRIHQNLIEPSEEWQSSLLEIKDKIRLKIALLNQGARISSSAKFSLAWKGGMREGVYRSLDIDIDGSKYNVPLSTKLSALSPFEIDYRDGRFVLCYHGQGIVPVDMDLRFPYLTKATRGGIPLERIFLLATDRLRIQNCSFCTFVEAKMKCRFCEAIHYPIQFRTDDVLEAIEGIFSLENRPFRHVMIGGLSNHRGQEREPILKICRRIRQFSDMPIYLMCLPPEDLSDIDAYIQAGVTEFGFNLEVFDQDIAREIMPGKGLIPLDQYDAAFRYAHERLRGSGWVYSALVVGLEPGASLLAGVEHLCRMGVRPILSPFLALPETPFQSRIPLSNAEIRDIYHETLCILAKHGMELGPDCPECRNNTL